MKFKRFKNRAGLTAKRAAKRRVFFGHFIL